MVNSAANYFVFLVQRLNALSKVIPFDARNAEILQSTCTLCSLIGTNVNKDAVKTVFHTLLFRKSGTFQPAGKTCRPRRTLPRAPQLVQKRTSKELQ